MKIVVIHGQSHKGSTYHITKLLVDRLAKEDGEVLEFQTNDLRHCTGCFNCIMKGEELCPHKGEIQPIVKAIEEANVIIIESPNYCMEMSGQLKTLFDHMAYRWISHRPHPSMVNKIGVAVSTTAGVGAGGVTKRICKQMFWWGIPKTYRVAQAVAAMSWKEVKPEKKAKIEHKLDKLAKQIEHKTGRVKQGIKYRFLFRLMGKQQKINNWNPVDRNHWLKNGWIS
jgi:multimeric flavodoxin WrbA